MDELEHQQQEPLGVIQPPPHMSSRAPSVANSYTRSVVTSYSYDDNIFYKIAIFLLFIIIVVIKINFMLKA